MLFELIIIVWGPPYVVVIFSGSHEIIILVL
jgi:hypothetical protein